MFEVSRSATRSVEKAAFSIRTLSPEILEYTTRQMSSGVRLSRVDPPRLRTRGVVQGRADGPTEAGAEPGVPAEVVVVLVAVPGAVSDTELPGARCTGDPQPANPMMVATPVASTETRIVLM